MNKKSVHLHTEDERFWDAVDKWFEPAITLFGNPAVQKTGSVALRHQIALVLPLSENCFNAVETETS